jgi:hypothetical protein
MATAMASAWRPWQGAGEAALNYMNAPIRSTPSETAAASAEIKITHGQRHWNIRDFEYSHGQGPIMNPSQHYNKDAGVPKWVPVADAVNVKVRHNVLPVQHQPRHQEPYAPVAAATSPVPQQSSSMTTWHVPSSGPTHVFQSAREQYFTTQV